jgi:hypothetical protein
MIRGIAVPTTVWSSAASSMTSSTPASVSLTSRFDSSE